MYIFIVFGLIGVIFATSHATPLVDPAIDNALNVLRNTFEGQKYIKEFFQENIVRNGDINYCGKPSNCAELLLTGFTNSGVYKIYPKPWMNIQEMNVYCDMETDGGGWTLLQRRGDFKEPHINFTRGWSQYAEGFGNLTEEFWLGNENIHALSTQDNVILRFDLEDFEGNKREAKYKEFEVGGREEQFKIRVDKYSGDAGDGFSGTNGAIFVTVDRDNNHICANLYKGGWWYTNCHQSNLNGRYLHGNHTTFADGVNWKPWLGYHYSLKRTEIKIRPKEFCPT